MQWLQQNTKKLLVLSSIMVLSERAMGVSFYRKMEGFLGRKILNYSNEQSLKKAKMIKKEVVLPDMGLTVHYYERRTETRKRKRSYPDGDSSDISQAAAASPHPTLVLFHGITDEAKNFASMVAKLGEELPHWRIVVPDLIGHGHDLDRAKQQQRVGGVERFEYPTLSKLIQSMKEFFSITGIEECVAFGISMGGALVYFLQQQEPRLVRSSILISPAMKTVLDARFVSEFQAKQKNHFCYESRDDIKCFFRDLSSPNRKRMDPIPNFFLEAIWQRRLAMEPPGHFRAFFQKLLLDHDATSRGEQDDDSEYRLRCQSDIDPQAVRLVIWPRDDCIANHDQGQAFFANSSPATTTFHSLPDCGHLFHADGRTVMDHATPVLINFLKQQENERPRGGYR